MTVFQSVAYGLVQGLGEFLPISSSAHLTLLPWVAGWRDPGLAFDVALHIGTLLALLVYFRSDILSLTRAFVASVVEREIGWYHERKLAWLVVLASVPGAVFGLLLEHKAEEAFRSPMLIGCTMIGMGAVLYLADRLSRQTRPLGSLGMWDALAVGLAQATALVPGVSRSGSTITAGRLLGMEREAAARFSFLLSIPITAGAALVKVPKLIQANGVDSSLLIGIGVAGLSGYLAIEVLLRFVRTRSYLPFVIYRVVFGLGIFALIVARSG